MSILSLVGRMALHIRSGFRGRAREFIPAGRRNLIYFPVMDSSTSPQIRAALAAVILAGGAVRITSLGRESLWLDEAFSLWYSSLPLRELWTAVPLYETHPPFYHALLKGWKALFGESEAAMRSLSALAGTATIPLVYLLGRQAAGPLAGVFAAAILALSPTHIYYSQETRPYALLVLCATGAMLAAWWLGANPKKAALPMCGLRASPDNGAGHMEARRNAALAWGALAAFSALCLWLHNVSGFLMAALIASTFPRVLGNLERPGWFLINALMAAAAAVALWSPFLPVFAKQMGNVAGSFWAPGLSWWTVYAGLMEIFFAFMYIKPFMAFMLALAAYGLIQMGRGHGLAAAWAMASLMLVPLILILAFCFAIKPVFVPRTILWITIPFMVLAGAGLAQAGGQRWTMKAALAFVALAGFAAGDYNYLTSSVREPWRQMAALTAKDYKKGDVILLLPNSLTIPFGYYASRLHVPFKTIPLPEPFPAKGTGRPYPSGNMAEPGFTQADLAMVEAVDCQSASVWAILRRPADFDPDNIILKNLDARCAMAHGGSVRDILIYRFHGKKQDHNAGR